MKIQQRKHGRGHSYFDAETGERVPGVTTITGDGLPKPALMKWAADATAEFAVDNWDDLAKMTPTARLKRIQGGRWEARDAAANKGRQIHALAERLLAGEKVVVPDELAGYVQSCVRFLDDFDARAVHVEAVVYSVQNRHSGQLDLIADVLLPDMPEYEHIGRGEDGYSRGLLDWKTGRSGIFGDVALQLAPYRFSDYLVQADGTVIDMPQVDFCAGIHLRTDGYQLVPLVCEREQYRDFLYVKEVARIVDGLRDLVGEPIVAPTASAYRLTQADEHGQGVLV